MTTYCTDVDLIRWEPNVLREAAFVSQTLLAGTGTLAGTAFTIAAGSLVAANVLADHVIVLGGDVNGCFPIVTIDSATALTLSVLYDGIEDEPPVARAPSASGSIPFAIRTFWPQRAIVSELLNAAAGAGVARGGETPATIVNTAALKRPCALGTLQMIYSALAAASPDDEHYSVRAELYERLYRRAMRSVSVDVDLDGDGEADAHRELSVLNFRRS